MYIYAYLDAVWVEWTSQVYINIYIYIYILVGKEESHQVGLDEVDRFQIESI